MVVSRLTCIALTGTVPQPSRRLTLERGGFDPAGVLHRRTCLKLHDKLAALTNLARHLGMFIDRHVPENSIEHKVMIMTPAERVEMAQQLLEKGRKYLPVYEEWERERSREGGGHAPGDCGAM